MKSYFFFSLVLLLLLIPFSLIRPLYPRDEGRYAEVARQALDGGHWLIPHLNGVPHFSKPPLYYDITASVFAVLGQGRLSVRLGSILAFLGCLLLSIRWAKRFGTSGAGEISALLTICMVQAVISGQFGDLNMVLTFFMTSGLLFLADALISPVGAGGSWIAGWVFIALAFLVKGPPALIIPLGTILTYRLIKGKEIRIGSRRWLLAIAIFLLVAAPWYVWVIAREEGRLINFWSEDIFRRTAVGRHQIRLYLLFYYVLVFIVGTSGWGLVLICRGISRVRETWEGLKESGILRWMKNLFRGLSPFETFLLSWILFTLLFFSLLRATMASYIQPLYPAVAMFLGINLSRKAGGLRGFFFRYRKRLLASFIATHLVVLLFACSYLFAGHAADTEGRIVKMYELNVIGDLLEEKIGEQHPVAGDMANKRFDLVQVDIFAPYFNFILKRDSILVGEEVHQEWHEPSYLEATPEEIRGRIEKGDPLVLFMERKVSEKMGFNNIKGLETIYGSKRYVVYQTSLLQR